MDVCTDAPNINPDVHYIVRSCVQISIELSKQNVFQTV